MTDDMFSRWSRRKAAVAREETEEKQDLDDDLEANRLAAEAVDLETLGPGSDLSVFLRRGVPEALRNQALGTVWRSDPVFSNLDGLIDHGEDFNAPGIVMPSFKSAWQAGRGYLKAATEDTPAPEPVETLAETEATPAAEEPARPPDPVPETDVAEAPPAPDDTPPKVSLRRRMGV